jgi:hypothetical protein
MQGMTWQTAILRPVNHWLRFRQDHALIAQFGIRLNRAFKRKNRKAFTRKRRIFGFSKPA